jgi:hypothetical protein
VPIWEILAFKNVHPNVNVATDNAPITLNLEGLNSSYTLSQVSN